ncbi:MAG TPA: hypothetical protein PKB15_07850 [Acidimicrobiia bacterium]|nr:hypothetical protein [Acidimicrobiia bacterium]
MPLLQIPLDGDHYLRNPPQKPKLELGNYVESQGIFVPVRYASFDEANECAANGYFVRSEHRLEYAGPSDIFDTYQVKWSGHEFGSKGTNFNLASWQQHQRAGGYARNKYVPEAYGYDPRLFEMGINFSIWDAVEGLNRFMFADPAQHGRYYVGTYGELHQLHGNSIQIGDSMWSGFHAITKDSPPIQLKRLSSTTDWPLGYGTPSELIDFYEMIRYLHHFDSDHIPIIEFQSDPAEGIQWFLQYHRGRDSQRANFTLSNRDIPPHAVVFDHVIGATHPDGQDCEVAIAFADNRPLRSEKRAIEGELLARCNVPVLLTTPSLPRLFRPGVSQHGTRSLWSKPPLSLFLETDGRHKGVANTPVGLGRNSVVREIAPGLHITFAPMHVVSDGKSAYATAY